MTPERWQTLDRLVREALALPGEQRLAFAITACAGKIHEQNLDVALIDAEQTFDGKSIYFYFLGDSSPELDAITSQLAEAYESEVQFRKFSDAVNEGCGPGHLNSSGRSDRLSWEAPCRNKSGAACLRRS